MTSMLMPSLGRTEKAPEDVCASHYPTEVPSSAPTLIVMPRASAPQNVTRMAAIVMFAPPVYAASAPNSARKTSEVADTARINCVGNRAATRSGRAAPNE